MSSDVRYTQGHNVAILLMETERLVYFLCLFPYQFPMFDAFEQEFDLFSSSYI